MGDDEQKISVNQVDDQGTNETEARGIARERGREIE
jgi:hypothetical protein